jgi:Na+(H+)/acetate symporter ActP
LCLGFIVISVVLAILNEEFGLAAIAYMMGISWGTLAGCFMGPYVLGVIWKRVTKAAVWASISSSLALTIILIVVLGLCHPQYEGTFGSMIKQGVSCSPLIGVICMAFSLVITVIVTLCTKKPNDEILYNAFDKPIEGEIK